MTLEPPGSRRPGFWAASIGAAIALAVLVSACGSSSLSYVSSSDRNAYFKVPSNWRFFDKKYILVASGQSLSAESNRQLCWLIGFDADPHPSVQHVIDITDAAEYPVVRLVQANAGEILTYKDVVLPGGLHGNKVTFDVILQGISNPASGSSVIRVTQIGVADPATRKLYLFMIRCESHCYRDNKTLIDQIVDSWTVKER